MSRSAVVGTGVGTHERLQLAAIDVTNLKAKLPGDRFRAVQLQVGFSNWIPLPAKTARLCSLPSARDGAVGTKEEARYRVLRVTREVEAAFVKTYPTVDTKGPKHRLNYLSV